MQYALHLMTTKGLVPAQAVALALQHFNINLTAAAVKNLQHHPSKLAQPVSRHTKISTEDEDRMVKTILMMHEMKLPTELSVEEDVQGNVQGWVLQRDVSKGSF